jgi:hypothetical protein
MSDDIEGLSCPKLYLEDIDRKDLLKFAAFLGDEKEQAPRSVYNKFENVMTFLWRTGFADWWEKNDWPRYTEEEPETYDQEELDTLIEPLAGASGDIVECSSPPTKLGLFSGHWCE